MTNKKPFINWVLHGTELPFHQNLIYWLSPTAALEQSLRATWDSASWAAVLILPQIKLNSQLSSCTSFLSRQWAGGFFTTEPPEKSCYFLLMGLNLPITAWSKTEHLLDSSPSQHPSITFISLDYRFCLLNTLLLLSKPQESISLFFRPGLWVILNNVSLHSDF